MANIEEDNLRIERKTVARALNLNCSSHLLDKGDIYGVLF